MANGTIIVAAGTEDTHDLCIGDDGQIITLSGIEAYAQVINCNMRTILGEKQLDLRDGLPYFQTIFSNPNTVSIWEAEVRRMITSLPFVINIKSFDTEVSDGVLRYKMVIETDLGDKMFYGGVNEREVVDSRFVYIERKEEEKPVAGRILKFITGEGVDPIPPMVLEPGQPIFLPDAVSIGKDFVGWYTDEELTERFTSAVMPDADISLYPKFETWTEFEIEIRENFVYYNDAGQKITRRLMLPAAFSMRICSTMPDEITTIDWGDGIITQGRFRRSYTQAGSNDGEVVHHLYNAPYGSRFRIRISSNCFKFVVGTEDPANHKKTDGSLDPKHIQTGHILVSRLLSWSEKIKNTYRTFSGCVNLSGSIPDFPKNMAVRVPGSNCEGYQSCGGTFEYTNVDNIVSEWPEGMTVIDHCFAWTDRAAGDIPVIHASVVNCARTFYKAKKVSPTPKLAEETDEEYRLRIMPTSATSHTEYVDGTSSDVMNNYLKGWGGNL